MHRLHLHHLLALALALAPLLLGGVADAAHPARSRTSSSRGPSSPGSGGDQKYDRSISVFSDAGRLLQVEYGIAASNRGGTVACLQLDYDHDVDVDVRGGGDENRTSSSSPGTASTSSVVCVAVATRSGGGAVGDDEVSDKVHRVDDHCLLITTGLSGDGRALARATRLACQRMRLSNGEPPTPSEIALCVADMQHELTRTGGGRPFGTTATVVGVDPPSPHDDEDDGEEEGFRGDGGDERSGAEDPSASSPGPSSSRWRPPSPWGTVTTTGSSRRRARARAFQSEPGGTVEEHTYCSAGRGRDAAALALGELRSRLLLSSPAPLDEEPSKNATASASPPNVTSSVNVNATSSTSTLNATTTTTTTTNSTTTTTTNSNNSTAAEEPEPVLSLEDRIAMGVAGAVFESDEDAERVDVWWIEPCRRRRRGGIWIRCAGAVGRDDVDTSLPGLFSSSPRKSSSS